MTAAPQSSSKEGWLLAHDGPVVLVALLLLLGGYLTHGVMTAPRQATFERAGLTFTYPAGWFPTDPEPGAFPVVGALDSGEHPEIKLTARISTKPPVDGPIESIVSLRGNKYGELYKELASGARRVAGRDWVRSEFTYAYKLNEDDAPRLGFAIEYAAVNNENLYVVTLHGPKAEVLDLEGSILGTVILK